MCPRYAISVSLSYVAFLGLVRSWLAYVAQRFRPLKQYPDPLTPSEAKGASDSMSPGPHWWEWLELSELFGAGEGCGWLLLVVAAGIVAVMFLVAAILLIWESPAILADAAFDFFLAAGLTQSLKKVDRPDWTGSVLTATCKPFFCVLAITIVVGLALELCFPGASTMKDVLKLIRR